MSITKIFQKWSKAGDVSVSPGSPCLAHTCPFTFDPNSLLVIIESL